VSQELDFFLFKLTLGKLDVIVVITKQVEDFVHMINMLFSSFAENEDVINVYYHKFLEVRPSMLFMAA